MLCNKLKPGTVDMKRLNKREGPMFHMQNIDFATEGFKSILPNKYRARIFRSPDLYEKSAQYPRSMWICLEALMKECDGGGGSPSPSRSPAPASPARATPSPARASPPAQAIPPPPPAARAAPAKKELPPALARDVQKTQVRYTAASSGGASTTGDYGAVKTWVEGKLGERLSDDLWEWAHDGRRLCKLANALVPGSCDMGMLNKRSGPIFEMQNIDHATTSYKKMLPPKFQARLFRSPDLYEKKSSYPKGIWICLEALMKLEQQGKMPKRV